MTSAGCFNDFRFVSNPEIMKNVRAQIDTHRKELDIEEYLLIWYSNTIFVVDSEDLGSIVVSTPVLNRIFHMIGEVVTTVEIQQTERLDINGVLSYFTSSSSGSKLSYGQPEYFRVPSGDQNKNTRHVSASLFAIFLNDVKITDSDRVYFMATNKNIEDLSIIHETCDGVKTIFKFQPPFGVVKLAAKPATPPNHEKPWSWLFDRTHNNWGNGEYIRLQEQKRKEKMD